MTDDTLESRLLEMTEDCKEGLPNGLYVLIMDAVKTLRENRESAVEQKKAARGLIGVIFDYMEEAEKYERRFRVCRREMVDARRRFRRRGHSA